MSCNPSKSGRNLAFAEDRPKYSDMASNFTDLLVGSPFYQSLRQSQYAFPVRPNFLASSSFRLANPRNHVVNTDKVTQILPASAIAGLSDENVLGLFSKGFFGGFIFSIERTILWFAGGKLLPFRYTGILPTHLSLSCHFEKTFL